MDTFDDIIDDCNSMLLIRIMFFSVCFRSSVISTAISYFASLLRSLPISVQDNMVRQFLGKTWSATAVAVTCSHLLQVWLSSFSSDA